MITWNQGMAQQTMAVQALYQRASGRTRARASGARKSKRTSKKASAAPRRKKATRAAGRAAKFVKGSKAAKAHMAKLRKMVGKRRA